MLSNITAESYPVDVPTISKSIEWRISYTGDKEWSRIANNSSSQSNALRGIIGLILSNADWSI
jgi:hypothetical protein